MPPADLVQSLRADLEKERDQLRSQLAEHGVDAMSFDENFADSAQVAAGQGEEKVLVNRLTDALADVEQALVKIDDGSYGTCARCGQEIAQARLEAMPSTQLCIDCASRA